MRTITILTCSRSICTLVVCSTIASVMPLLASGGALVPLKLLVSKADAIVVGNVLSASLASQIATMTLEIQDVLKGTVQPGTVLSADYRMGGDAARNWTIGKERGLFFLQYSNGRWSIMPVVSGSTIDARLGLFLLPPNSTPKGLGSGVQPSVHEQILAWLAGGLETGEVPIGGFVDWMAEYRSNASPAMRALFARFKTSASPILRRASLRASIVDADHQLLAELEQGTGARSAADVRVAAEEIQYYLTSTAPPVIASLGRMALSQRTPVELRKAALVALARAHSRDSLPYLAAFLDDTDAEMRSLAVGGLAMFANNVPAGAHEPAAGPWQYRTDETIRYAAMDSRIIQSNPAAVMFWKSWWEQHREKLQ
jgi:hypothetical protein